MEVKTENALEVLKDIVAHVAKVLNLIPNIRAVERFFRQREKESEGRVSQTIAKEDNGVHFFKLTLSCHYEKDIIYLNMVFGCHSKVFKNLNKKGFHFYHPIDVPSGDHYHESLMIVLK